MSTAIRRLQVADSDFQAQLDGLLALGDGRDEALEKTVAEILAAVRTRGDEALLEYTNRFDARSASIEDLEIPRSELESALQQLDPEIKAQLEQASRRIGDSRTASGTDSPVVGTTSTKSTPLCQLGAFGRRHST